MEKRSRRSFLARLFSGTTLAPSLLLLLGAYFSTFSESTVKANLILDVGSQIIEDCLPILVKKLGKKHGDTISSTVSCSIKAALKSFGTGMEDENNHSDLISHFEQIQKELEKYQEELQFINQEIKKLTLSVIYSQHEEKIKNSLLTFREYLWSGEERNRNLFIDNAADLDQSIRVLIDGLQGQHSFSPNIMKVIRDSVKCDSSKIRKNVKSIVSLIVIGLEVREEYLRITNVTERTSSPFEEYIQNAFNKLNKKLHDMLIECQADEGNVSDEIRHIIDNSSVTTDRKIVVRSLLEFLEEKYDTKQWIVIMLRKSTSDESLDSVWTGRFHYVSVGTYTVFAISVDPDRNFSEFKTLIDIHMKEFYIPGKKGKYLNYQCSNPSEIEEYLHRFLIPVRAKSDVEMEMLVSKMDMQNMITLSSNGVENTFILMQDRPSNDIQCDDPVLVIVVPTRQITFNQSPFTLNFENSIECSYDPRKAANNFVPLRNERIQAYLSVQGDSKEEGAPVILDSHWRNSPGQKWKFLDGWLRNEFGKCLTFDSPYFLRRIYLYQDECFRIRQKWYFDGLQIYTYVPRSPSFNIFTHYLNRECLMVKGNAQSTYFTVDDCDMLPSSLWYKRNTDCEDAMTPSSSGGSRALRNEFSRLFLSAVKQYGMVKPWMNRPTQRWKFVDGLLRNEDGKCLAGNGWYVQEVACDSGRMGNNGRWTYTENRQIRSKDGYCLSSSGDLYGNVYYGHCKDEPGKRWR